MRAYVVNVLLGLDMFLSALLAGKPGETLSGRAGSAAYQGTVRGRAFSAAIDLFFGKGHCARARLRDMARAQAVITDQGVA